MFWEGTVTTWQATAEMAVQLKRQMYHMRPDWAADLGRQFEGEVCQKHGHRHIMLQGSMKGAQII